MALVNNESADLELSDTAEASDPIAQEEQIKAITKQEMRCFILNSNTNVYFFTIIGFIGSPELLLH
jgi:hypothetical protein